MHTHPLHHTYVAHCTALHRNALQCTAPHCTALHCTTLHRTALRYVTMRRMQQRRAWSQRYQRTRGGPAAPQATGAADEYCCAQHSAAPDRHRNWPPSSLIHLPVVLSGRGVPHRLHCSQCHSSQCRGLCAGSEYCATTAVTVQSLHGHCAVGAQQSVHGHSAVSTVAQQACWR